MQPDIEAILNSLRGRFRPDAVKKRTIYYLSLGEGSQDKWTLTLSPTSCDVTAGKPSDADCVLKMSAELFVRLVEGTFKPGAGDFFSGKMKTSDLGRLRQLQTAFGL